MASFDQIPTSVAQTLLKKSFGHIKRVLGRSRACSTLLVLASFGVCAAPPLPAYNVDIHETSVSGISSGAFMAVQFDVAYSSIVKGAGVVAGGPFFCSEGTLEGAARCMNATSPIDVPRLIQKTQELATQRLIDPVENLKRQRIWIFSGALDTVVRPPAGEATEVFFKELGTPANVKRVKKPNAEHTMPTANFGNGCSVKSDPYISNCNEDAAGQLLQWIYPDIAERSGGPLGGKLVEFDQNEFINASSHSMNDIGWVYVPQACAKGEPCRLHVALHGCLQYPKRVYPDKDRRVTFGSTFAEHAGYNEWADQNHLIVLYPEAGARTFAFPRNLNPFGCWDWWGYDSAVYHTQQGAQLAAIKKMVGRIASGHTP